MRRGAVRPPQKMTVTMLMRLVVVRNICLAMLTVFRLARAKAMAPRKPENQSRCWCARGICSGSHQHRLPSDGRRSNHNWPYRMFLVNV